jgi:serine/threonine protein kinase
MEFERLGPYRIVGKLGRGGMGTVYEGLHSETGESAAVKLLSAALAEDEGFRSRFEAEIETLRKLNHPNIVRLFGFGEQDGHLFYAMELVRGNSLEEELRRGRRFDWREVARIGIETCRALRHAHDRGVIHRDIKPGNLLLTADGSTKLSDFGIARLFGYTRLTNAGNILGTAEYMAPEQADGRPVDARADLYSLGALMYALLAGRPVFRGKSLPEVLHKQRFDSPEPVRKYAADAPQEFESIVSQLLEKEPGRRIANADLLARRLEAMLHALSLGAQTVESDTAWFLPKPPAPSAPPQEPAAAGNGAPPAGSSGTFVAVSEEELGKSEDDGPAAATMTSWWQTGALAAALLLVGMSVLWFLRPPTADTLYERIAARTADGSIDSILQAESDIQEFLNRYSDDLRAAKLRDYQKEIDLRRLDRRFDLRIKGLSGGEDLTPVERAYLDAMSFVRLDPQLAATKLQAMVALYDRPGGGMGTSDLCLVLAKRRIEQLRGDAGKQTAEQIALLRSRLDAADALRETQPLRAAAIYRAVVQLYADKPWAAEVVARARKALHSP